MVVRRSPVAADGGRLEPFELGRLQPGFDDVSDGAGADRDATSAGLGDQLRQREVGLARGALEHDGLLLTAAGQRVASGVDAEFPRARPTALSFAASHPASSVSHRSVRRR